MNNNIEINLINTLCNDIEDTNLYNDSLDSKYQLKIIEEYLMLLNISLKDMILIGKNYGYEIHDDLILNLNLYLFTMFQEVIRKMYENTNLTNEEIEDKLENLTSVVYGCDQAYRLCFQNNILFPTNNNTIISAFYILELQDKGTDIKIVGDKELFILDSNEYDYTQLTEEKITSIITQKLQKAAFEIIKENI